MIGPMMKQNRCMQNVAVFAMFINIFMYNDLVAMISTTSRRFVSGLNNSAGSLAVRSLPAIQASGGQQVQVAENYQPVELQVQSYPMMSLQSMMPQTLQKKVIFDKTTKFTAIFRYYS